MIEPMEPQMFAGIETTPLMELDGVLAKLECGHPSGSIKDRIAVYILRRSEEAGLLRPGMRIVEATSGNTGVALAHYGRKLGYQVTIVMPEHMTEERKELIKAQGAELILCSKEGSFCEAAQIRDDMAANDPNVFNPNQFSNPLNVECHRLTTGQELIRQAGRKIDAFVAGVGTGGTLIGVGEALRERWPDALIVAVEPTEAAVMSGDTNGSHQIFGIGDGFIPEIAGDGHGGTHPMIGEVIQISSQDAIKGAHQLRTDHGLCAGISSGANFLAARQLRERFETVATVFSDGHWKYRSHGLTMCCSQTGCAHQSVCRNTLVAQ